MEEGKLKPQKVSFGKGSILMSNPDFVNGFQAGHLAYMVALRSHIEPYSDNYLMELFLDRLEDVHLSSSYGIGYAVGWLNTLATKGS